MRELLQSAIEIERESINGREIRLDVPKEIPLALVDHTLIEQAVAKLLANAGAHTPARLPIEIDADYTDDHLVISVAIGDLEFRPKQLSEYSKNSTEATIAKPVDSGSGYRLRAGLIEAHGGKIDGRESRWRRRTLHHQSAGSRDRSGRNGNDVMKAARTALIIDDEKQIRRLLRIALEEAGHQVYEAETGQAGLAEIVQRRPDVVLLDLGLPDMEGIKVLRRLREWSDVPVLILSVRDDPEEKVAALDAGADDYVTKPFDTAELLARVRAAQRRSLKRPVSPSLTPDRFASISRRGR